MNSLSLHPAARGFTLIELMIAMIVVAVLAAIALPAYMDSVRKGRRADAVSLMSQVAQAEERWRANASTYSNDFGTSFLNVRSTAASGVTSLSERYYLISVVLPASPADATAYSVRAVAQGSQASDQRCTAMEMRMNAGNAAYVSATSAGAIGASTTDTHRCWGR